MGGEWKQTVLEEIAEIEMGQSPSGETCNKSGIGIPLLNGPTEFGDYHPIPVQFTLDPKKITQSDDILFCVRDSTTGSMNWADQKYAIGRGIAAIRHRYGSEHRYFLKALIDYSLDRLLTAATGSTFPNVSREQLAKLPCSIPPLPEQRSIAEVLGALDDKIELNRRMNATIEAMARAVFHHWFVEGAEVKGWEEGSILEIADLLSGGTPRTSEPDYWNGSIPWVSAKDVGNVDGIFLIKTEKEITQAGLDNSSTKMLPAKTTIITARGTVGAHCMLGRDMTMNQTNYGIKAKKGIGDVFIFFTLSNMVEQLKQQSYGTIFDTITTRTFQNAQCVHPPIKVIDEFEKRVSPFMDTILNNQEQSRTLAALRDALLPKLMRGEVKIGDFHKTEAGK